MMSDARLKVEEANILCPECGRPMVLEVDGAWSRVPCWVEDGELHYSLFDGDWEGSYVRNFVCTGCRTKLPATVIEGYDEKVVTQEALL